MSTRNEQFLDRLLQLAALLGDDTERELGRLGLTRSRAHVLWSIAGDGPKPQHALAGELGVTPRAITGIVDALAADGHAERRAHPSDRRAVLVALTPSGERMMQTMQRDHAQLADALVEGVPAEDREALDRGLASVIARLQELIEAAS
ncbi:MarR family winged helix-turn-helix transcriptional regulator [Agrococcus baldri]|uniref:Transcriptional regulator n=1 Tax=Agrococcus baldri TaxID=153730 RepID=A0AA87US08_9MICO|nr:MarR family transcriptional regulator [Agrococcus baldri]GEK80443.1 transcriptional regulator [Agrococcus baldri]